MYLNGAGIFSGKYRVLTNVPISISTALAASCVPALAAAFAQKDDAQVRSKIGISMRFIVAVAMPLYRRCLWCWQIRSFSFCSRDQVHWQEHLLQAGGISVILSISTLSNAILQGIDQMHVPVRKCFCCIGTSCRCDRGGNVWF